MNPSRSPDSYRRYTPGQVAEAADAIRPRLASGLLTSPETERLLILRDLSGAVWAHGLRSKRWYLHQSGSWVSGQPLPQILEGVAALAGQLPRESSIPPEHATVSSAEDSVTPAPEAAVELVKRLRQAYQAGMLSTAEAEMVLDELVLLDPAGDLWAPGFESDRWYRLAGTRWEAAPGAPRAGAGLEGRAPPPEAAAQALGRLEAAIPRFPEPLSPGWTPTPDYPERLACPQCGSALSTASEICPVCGGPAPLLSSGQDGHGMPAATAASTLRVGAADLPSWGLTVVEGRGSGQSFTLQGEVNIGRGSENEIRLDDPGASSRHAKVGPAGSGFRVVDLGSTNGTFLNGDRLMQPADLRPGDRLQMSGVVLEVVGPALCARCGALIAAGDAFCGECGEPVSARTLKAPVASPVSPGAVSAGGMAAPTPAPTPPHRSRPFGWKALGIGCAVVLALAGGGVLCLLGITLLQGS